MTAPRSLVVVVDDDASVRESLPELLQELGFAVRTYPSADAFLASRHIDETDCLVVDIDMPDKDGFELLNELQMRGHDIPAVLMTANADEAVRSHVGQGGVVACLLKPFGEAALLEAIGAALGHRRPPPDQGAVS